MRAGWRAECEDLDKESEELGAKDGSGEPPHRRENRRFLTGRGRYVHNIVLPQQLHAVFLRSSHAHAENRSDR